MNIYDFEDFRQYLTAFLKELPKQGHGFLKAWAEELGVSSTLMSQILSSKKSLSLEHGIQLAGLLGLAKKETDYFLLLVQFDRAGNKKLQDHFAAKIHEAREASRLLKNRVQNVVTLSDEIKARYYSSWTYSGLRNQAVCDGMKTAEDLARALNLPRPLVAELLDFLIEQGLLKKEKEGWGSGANSTYLPSDHVLISKHHINWRLKAMQQMEYPGSEALFYTAPMSLSKDMAKELRKYLVDVIEELHQKADPTPSEEVRCLSIDWFQY